MSLFLELLDSVSKGKKFRIDLINKSLTIGKTKRIQDGIVLGAEVLFSQSDLQENLSPWEMVSHLYQEYKYSAPTTSKLGNKSYFRAKDDLSLAELIRYENDRNVAQAKLEGYILLAGLQGILTWENERHWFWQGEDKQLVVLKNWVKRKGE